MCYSLNGVGVGQGLAKGLKCLTILPALASAIRGGASGFVGSATACHAAIVTRVSSPGLITEDAELVHAVGTGVKSIRFSSYEYQAGMSLAVFRLKIDDIPPRAAEVARTWGPTEDQASQMTYSAGNAGLSVFRSSSFGDGAKQRAVWYRRYKDTVGGPPEFQKLEAGTAAMFCSMFVIACYQAVMQDADIGQVLALDAQNTSPMYLDGYLKSSEHWKAVPPRG
jgi:hypothetical protein